MPSFINASLLKRKVISEIKSQNAGIVLVWLLGYERIVAPCAVDCSMPGILTYWVLFLVGASVGVGGGAVL